MFIVIIIYGAQIMLYIKFLLGNDIIVNLHSDDKEIDLENGQSQKIKFTSSITSNPLCKSVCNSKFIDISNNKVIEEDKFSIKTGIPVSKEYTLSAEGNGTGQEIFRFDLECNNIQSSICQTEESKVAKSQLVLLNRKLNLVENYSKSYSYNKLNNRIEKINEINNLIIVYNNSLNKLDKIIYVNTLSIDLIKLMKEASNNSEIITEIKKEWGNQNFKMSRDNLDSTESDFNNLLYVYNYTNNDFNEKIKENNEFVSNMSFIKDSLIYFKSNSKYINNETLIDDLNELINEYNKITNVSSNKSSSINNSQLNKLVINLKLLSNILNEEISDKNESSNNWNVNKIDDFKFPIVDNIPGNKTFVEMLDNPSGICCIYGECKKCCESDECSDKKNYPIIFVHGHDFSRTASAEHSFEHFSIFQKELESDGVLNAGTLTLYDGENLNKIYSKIDKPLSFRISYYFDYYKSSKILTIVQNKDEKIDTYAIRLNELVKDIKEKTNRPKVNIVTYSMGGLVVRRYIQIFGSDDVNLIILIATPNKGIEGEVSKLCNIFGEKLECGDMDSNSLFINKLNRENLPDIPMHILIGEGCDMNGEDGDGVVLNRNSFIEGDKIKNYYFNGKCSGKIVFHNEILNNEKYPDVFEKVKEILKNDNLS